MDGTTNRKEPRKLSRQARRQQLIEATIETLAERGYARTTLSDVARTAGLSHGLVNFHFQSKENLLDETLQFLNDEYHLNWTAALAEAAQSPAEQLEAMIRADFNPDIAEPSRLRAWGAYWGEAQGRPLYLEKFGANDTDYNRKMAEICADIIVEGGYPQDAARVGRVVRVMMEGIWLDMMTTRQPYPEDEAMAMLHTCLAALFPRHFCEDGLIPRRAAE